jgi:hypothetical protein
MVAPRRAFLTDLDDPESFVAYPDLRSGR